MRIGAILSPLAEWDGVLRVGSLADRLGLDAVGLWDHYHSALPDHAYVAGWSALAALAARTERVRLVPMVLNGLHHQLGVLAKESSVLSHISHDRFELGVGAGDWPASFRAWGMRFPAWEERFARLEETVEALRLLWRGQSVTMDGDHVRLQGAICVPPPSRPPRVVIGVGGSSRSLQRAAAFADELNVYDAPSIIQEALDTARRSPRPMTVSVFTDWSWDGWPPDPSAAIASWAERGVERCFISVGGPDTADRIRMLAAVADPR